MSLPTEPPKGGTPNGLIFSELELAGACLVEVNPHEDERGLFARTFCAREFREQGLADTFVQCSTSYNVRKGTLRGMHYQKAPSCEVKLVRCTRGAIWDVIVDLRQESPTYLKSIGVELSDSNRRALYIPGMFAHGFLTLQDASEVFYQINEFYAPNLYSGLRYDDPALAIRWPGKIDVISERDRQWQMLDA